MIQHLPLEREGHFILARLVMMMMMVIMRLTRMMIVRRRTP